MTYNWHENWKVNTNTRKMKSSHLIGLKDWLRDFDLSLRAMRGVLGLLWVTCIQLWNFKEFRNELSNKSRYFFVLISDCSHSLPAWWSLVTCWSGTASLSLHLLLGRGDGEHRNTHRSILTETQTHIHRQRQTQTWAHVLDFQGRSPGVPPPLHHSCLASQNFQTHHLKHLKLYNNTIDQQHTHTCRYDL